MRKISTAIITYNEEKNIRRCIESVLPFSDEIVIVDSFSSDKTAEICREYDLIFIENPFEGHIQQKNFTIQHCSNEWIFSLDADEAASKELQEEIISWQKGSSEFSNLFVNRKTFYLTDWFKEGGWYPDKKIRLFRKEIAQWTGENPHDYIQITDNSPSGRLKGDLLHYTYNDLAHHLQGIQSFSRIAAEEKFKKGPSGHVWNVMVRPIFKFFKTYFLQRAFIRGTRGFIFSVMAAFSVFMKYAKLWELSIHEKMSRHK